MKFEALKNIIEKPISGEWGEEGEGVNVLRTTNFSNEGRINTKEVVVRNISEDIIETKKLQKGDIIIEKSGGSPTQPVGRVVYFDLHGVYLCNNFTSVIRPKNEIVDSKYLLYILFASHKFGQTNAYQNKTTGIINLQLKRYVDELKIPLPSLPTQKKIAEILDTSDSLRQKDKALIEKYNQLTQSLFLEMFGDPVRNEKNWPTIFLSEIVSKFETGKSVQSVEESEAGEYKVLKTSAVSWGQFLKEEAKWLPYGYNPPLNHFVKKGDLLMSRMNTVELVGASTYVFDDVQNLALPDRIWKFIWTEKKKVNPIFIWYGINRKSFRDKIGNVSSGTSGSMKNISMKKIMELEFIYPPIDLQNKFGKIIEEIYKQKQLAEANLEKSEALFNSLLQKAFTGELL